ncbi:MAG: HTH domain-containing protein [Candidatus Micrarchaeota archaeon]|nr:HTH domain-containing protein [Candidatus Micrarchaeota archaeon]
MGFYEAAEKVLLKAKKPMTAKRITEIALTEGLLKTDGKTPHATMAARLYMDIIRKGSDSKFVKLDRGLFGLKGIDYDYLPKTKPIENKSCAIVKEYSELMPSKLLDDFAEYFEGKSGVYALYNDKEELWYVGLANNLRTRLAQHQKDGHRQKWAYFRIFVVPRNKLEAVETILIQIARPKGNKTKGNICGARNITSEIKSEIKERIRKYRNYL